MIRLKMGIRQMRNKLGNGGVLLKSGNRKIFIWGSVRNIDHQRRLEKCQLEKSLFIVYSYLHSRLP